MAETKQYAIGRGRVSFAPFKPGTLEPDGFRFLGNAPALSFTLESEDLDHYSSTSGLRILDASVVLQTTITGSMTLDEIDPRNVAMFCYGESSDIAVTAAAGLTETISAVRKGRSYIIGVDAATQPSGAMSIDSGTFQATVGSTPLVAGTDYSLDPARGRILILPGATNVNDGDDVNVTYDQLAYTRTTVRAGTTQPEGALEFISYNPYGANRVWLFPHVRISASGEFGLISEEWQQMEFGLKILQPADGRAAIYVDGHPGLNTV